MFFFEWMLNNENHILAFWNEICGSLVWTIIKENLPIQTRLSFFLLVKNVTFLHLSNGIKILVSTTFSDLLKQGNKTQEWIKRTVFGKKLCWKFPMWRILNFVKGKILINWTTDRSKFATMNRRTQSKVSKHDKRNFSLTLNICKACVFRIWNCRHFKHKIIAFHKRIIENFERWLDDRGKNMVQYQKRISEEISFGFYIYIDVNE